MHKIFLFHVYINILKKCHKLILKTVIYMQNILLVLTLKIFYYSIFQKKTGFTVTNRGIVPI